MAMSTCSTSSGSVYHWQWRQLKQKTDPSWPVGTAVCACQAIAASFLIGVHWLGPLITPVLNEYVASMGAIALRFPGVKGGITAPSGEDPLLHAAGS